MNDEERKEAMRQKRRQAYLDQKERQKSDPKYIAMKESQKAMRREAYQQQKQKKADYMKALKQAKQEDQMQSREARDQELLGMLVKGSDLIDSE